MWEGTIEKIEELKSLDRIGPFGSGSHRYIRRPCVSIEEVEHWERINRVPLPEELKQFYLQVCDGPVGPYYGIFPLRGLITYSPDIPYPGIDNLREIVREKHPEYVEEDGEFQCPPKLCTGTARIIHEGCDHYWCIVTAGPMTGKLIVFSGIWTVHEYQKTFYEFYTEWLDTHIAAYRLRNKLMSRGATKQERIAAAEEAFPTNPWGVRGMFSMGGSRWLKSSDFKNASIASQIMAKYRSKKK